MMTDLERTGSSSSSTPPPPPPPSRLMSSFVMMALSKRRTWVILFLIVYALLLSSSWNLILSIRSWYNSAVSSSGSGSFFSAGWPALYASVLYGGVFGLLSMGAALSVAVPATVVTWITVLVLLAFAGKPRRTLVMEGRRITKDIASLAFKILIREGNLAAAVCAGLSFVALLVRRRRGQPQPEEEERDL